MCEPTTIAAIGSWFAGAGGTAAAAGGTAAAAGAATTAAAGLTTAQMVSLGLAAAGTVMSAKAAHDQSSIAKQVARNNAITGEIQAQDAQRRGEKDAQEIARRAALLSGTQRATMAARGLDLSEGTAQDVLDQTAFFASIDQGTARLNAAKEAWAKRAGVANYNAEASGYSPLLAGGTTLLAGATSVADKWMMYSRR